MRVDFACLLDLPYSEPLLSQALEQSDLAMLCGHDPSLRGDALAAARESVFEPGALGQSETLESVQSRQFMSGDCAPRQRGLLRGPALLIERGATGVDRARFGMKPFELRFLDPRLSAPPIEDAVEWKCKLLHPVCCARVRS